MMKPIPSDDLGHQLTIIFVAMPFLDVKACLDAGLPTFKVHRVGDTDMQLILDRNLSDQRVMSLDLETR